MRILLVNKFHYHKGGAETYYLTLGERLESMGHEVAYFSMLHPDNIPCAQERYFVTQREYNNIHNPLKAVRDGLALVYSPEAMHKFEALCEEFQPDVVHLNNVHRQITLSILDAAYLREHKVPVVYTAHDYVTVCPGYLMLDGEGAVCDACLKDGRYRHCAERRCVKGSRAKSCLAAIEAAFNRAHHSNYKIDAVIAPSRYMVNKLIEGGWPKNKVHYMQNFVSERILEEAAQTYDATSLQRPYLLFFGRLSAEKGVDVLIRAFEAALPKLSNDLRLVIAGDGPERDNLETLAGDNPRIEFVGFKSGEELQRLVSGAAFAVTPSVFRENMPYSIVEALAEGTPVVGTSIGGIPELVQEGETGLLAEPGDIESLANAIIKAETTSDDKSTYRVMQERCRSYVLNNCAQLPYINRLIRLYNGLIMEKLTQESC